MRLQFPLILFSSQAVAVDWGFPLGGGGHREKGGATQALWGRALGFGPPDGRQRAIWGGVARIHGRQRGREQHHGEAAVRLARCRLHSGRQQKEGERGKVSPS
jgi:hypothetical protein